jgi:hypothetical protein
VGKEGKDLNHTESLEQQALFQWAKLMQGQHPELCLLHSIPNGGKRNAMEAARLKKEGVLAGVSDVFLPVARGGYHGLYIEMKSGKGKPSDAQKWWIAKTTEQGYYSTVCYGWVDASEVIKRYLEG